MTTVSVAIPDELKQRMHQMDEVNWSAVARKAFEEKIHQIEFMKKLAQKSKLTEKDAEAISDRINLNMAKKFRTMK
ncbi:MAG TPA: hypothetical protein VJG90_02240 [Candidatus Nanoarchaeia archaeon]|nr:hypothetical protein [Candidatus Nanoarchaeia archaeon]